MKLLTVLGARPQFIKAAALSRRLRDTHVQEMLVHTGQHYDPAMSAVFFEELGLPTPQHHLNINRLNHGAMTGRMLEALEDILLQEKPDRLLVYGDTNSTLAGALAAAKWQIPVAHVEAGLRSFNQAMPEEINRKLTDHLSDLLFCPSEGAAHQLRQEGLQEGLHVVGDIMRDSVELFRRHLPTDLPERLGLSLPYLLATLHREENLRRPERMKDLLAGLAAIQKEMPVVLVAHPRLAQAYREEIKAFTVLPPQSYWEMLSLLSHARLVATDSGGLQKEAYYLGKYCLTLRTETEWTELTAAGVNFLCGSHPTQIRSAFQTAMAAPAIKDRSVYGAGDTADRIAKILGA